MAKDNIRLEKVLQDMSHSLNHIEDIMADDREILIKLVKQNNTIVEFLKDIEVESVPTEYEEMLQPALSQEEEKVISKYDTPDYSDIGIGQQMLIP